MIASTTADVAGIDNRTDDPAVWTALLALCECVLQPIRDHYGAPIRIASGYRCEALNRLVGGAPDSQHVLGEAADFVVDGVDIDDLMAWIVSSGLDYDQAIREPTWIHISHTTRRANRRQALVRTRSGYAIHT